MDPINYFTNLLNETLRKLSFENNPETKSLLENEKFNYISIIKNLTQQQNYNNFLPIYGEPEELLQCTLCNLTFKRIEENYVHTIETCTGLQIEKLKQIIMEKDMIINKLQKENEILNIENNEYLNKINLLYQQNQNLNNQLVDNKYSSNDEIKKTNIYNKNKNINEYEIKGLRNKNNTNKLHKNKSNNHLSNTYLKTNIINYYNSNNNNEKNIKNNTSLKNNPEKKNSEESTTMKSHRKIKSNLQDSFENYLDNNFSKNNNINNDWDELLNESTIKKQ